MIPLHAPAICPQGQIANRAANSRVTKAGQLDLLLTLRIWLLCLYFMGLNLSNQQIAWELSLNEDDVQRMTEQLRAGVIARVPAVRLEGAVEIDEVYVVAGHKGNPAAVAKKTAQLGAAD